MAMGAPSEGLQNIFELHVFPLFFQSLMSLEK
jgi:hypothetical protein